MQIQLASDLHLESVQFYVPGERLIQPAPGADLLALVGDIHQGLKALETFADWPVPVLYVPGNHEFYSHSMEQVRHQMRQHNEQLKQQGWRGPGMGDPAPVLVLDNDIADFACFGEWADRHQAVLQRLRFLGCTLWTDYELPTVQMPRSAQMAQVAHKVPDHRYIRTQEGMFMPKDARSLHEQSCAWLGRELAQPFEGRKVVLTHHAPHVLSLHARFKRHTLSGAYVSHLPHLVGQAHLWLHGHVHDNFDYRANGCRVVTNPRGYGHGWHNGFDQVRWENASFMPDLVLDLDDLFESE